MRLVALLVALPLSAVADDALRDELVKRYEKQMAGIDRIALNVRRTIRPAGAGEPLVQEWRFVYDDPRRFLVRVFKPEPRRELYGNDTEIWEYVPQFGKALKTDISGVSTDRKWALYRQASQPYAVPFLLLQEELGKLPELTVEDAGVVDGRPAWRFKSKQAIGDTTRDIVLTFDRDRLTPLTADLLGADGSHVHLRHSAHREVRPGLWLPTEITVEGTSGGAIAGFTLKILSVELNPTVSPRAFDFRPPDGTEITAHLAVENTAKGTP